MARSKTVRDLSFLLSQLTDRAFQISVSVITTLLAIVGIAATSKSGSIIEVCAIFVVTILLSLYIVLHISSVTAAALRHQTAAARRIQIMSRKLVDLEVEYADFKKHILVSDEAFRQLGISRTALDDNALSEALNGNRDKLDRISDAVNTYLRNVCDTAVDVYSARHKQARDQFSANIKIVGQEDGNFYYVTEARSSNSKTSRDDDDEKHYPILSNASLYEAIKSVHRMHIVPDVSKFIETYKAVDNEQFTAPIIGAEEFYLSSLSVLLYLKARSQRKMVLGHHARNAYRSARGDLVFGFMTIDSPTIVFSNSDVDILQELSIHALSVLRFHDFLAISVEHIGRNSEQ